jgi:hypothetical protein
MASLFRKIGANIAPAFRKLPSDVSTIGRKITNTALEVNKGLAQAEKVAETVDKYAPNPLTRTVRAGITGAKDITSGVGSAGQALRKVASGDVQGAGNLALSALALGTRGLGEFAGAGMGAFTPSATMASAMSAKSSPPPNVQLVG